MIFASIQDVSIGIGVQALLAVLILWALSRIVKAISDPLRHIPGPFIGRFTRLWLFRQYSKGDYQFTNIHLHQKHGPVVRIAPSQYSIDNIQAAKVIYGHGSHFLKSDWYAPWGHPEYENLFNVLDPKEHAAMRRKVANAYSMSSLVSYEPYVEECIDMFRKRLTEFSASKVPINMGHWLQCYAFDVIGMITFSTRFGFLDAGEDPQGVIQSLEMVAKMSSMIGVYPWSFHVIMSALKRLGSGKETGPIFIDKLAAKRVVAKRAELEHPNNDGPEDFVSKFLKIQKEKPDQITDMVIRILSGGNVAAGTDTTSITLSAILFYLYKHRSTLDKLRKELDENLASGAISSPITFKEAQSLPYLQAVVKEGLRMHPATGFTMPRIVPKGGKHLAGHFFPEGTTVGINAWVAHRNKEIFGDDADTFRPERWLESQEANSTGSNPMEEYFLAFGQGSRTCIGKNISLLEVYKLIPEIVRSFELELENEGELDAFNHWFVKPKGFRCVIRQRTD